jgi:hypothetical protein
MRKMHTLIVHFVGTDKFNLLSFQRNTMNWVILFIKKIPCYDIIRYKYM